MIKIHRKSKKNKGRKHTIDARIKMSNSLKGKIFSEEHKIKLGIVSKRRWDNFRKNKALLQNQ